MSGHTAADLPPIEFAFPGPLRDRIIAAIVAGEKTATSSLVREYEQEGAPLPAVGDRGVAIDSQGVAVAVLETTAVEIVALRDVSDSHARAEGEGYADAADWREGHLRFWTSPEMTEELGDAFIVDGDARVVLERFAVIERLSAPGGEEVRVGATLEGSSFVGIAGDRARPGRTRLKKARRLFRSISNRRAISVTIALAATLLGTFLLARHERRVRDVSIRQT